MISTENLRHFGVLTGIGEENLHHIAMIADERRVAADAVIFEEGQPANRLYLVNSGEIDIKVRLANGNRVVVDTIVAGKLLGWSAFLAPKEYHFDAVARVNSALIEIDAAELRALVDSDRDLGYRLMRGVAGVMSNRMQAARVQLAQLGA